MNNIQNIRFSPSNSSDALEIIRIIEQQAFNYDYISDIPLSKTRIVSKTSEHLPRVALVAGLIGFILAITFQYWSGTINYPMNIGNKPYFSWITSLPIAFEIAILFAGTSAFLVFIFNLKDNPITDISGRNSEITISINENDYDKLKIICQQQDIEIDGIKE